MDATSALAPFDNALAARTSLDLAQHGRGPARANAANAVFPAAPESGYITAEERGLAT